MGTPIQLAVMRCDPFSLYLVQGTPQGGCFRQVTPEVSEPFIKTSLTILTLQVHPGFHSSGELVGHSISVWQDVSVLVGFSGLPCGLSQNLETEESEKNITTILQNSK